MYKLIQKMKKIISAIIFTFSTYISVGQRIVNVDFDAIKKETKDSNSVYFFPTLLERLSKNDSNLDINAYYYIYYGSTYTEQYNPYGTSNLEDSFLTIYNKGEYRNAIPIGLKVLEENPINLKITFKVMVCYHALDILDSSHTYARKYYSFIDVIYKSGDGKSSESAYVVIEVDDEYQVLADLGLESTGQALLFDNTYGPTDLLNLSTQKKKKKKDDNNLKKLYFNVSKPFENLSKEFKKNNK